MVTPGQFLHDAVCPRKLLAGGLAVLALAVLAAIFLPGTVANALDQLADADRGWLLLGVASLLASSVASAGIWHEGMAAAGRRASLGDACARYGVGSLVNSFTPGRLGEVARLALFSQTVPEEGRAWATGGGVVAIVAARAVAMATVLCAPATASACRSGSQPGSRFTRWRRPSASASASRGRSRSRRSRRRRAVGSPSRWGRPFPRPPSSRSR